MLDVRRPAHPDHTKAGRGQTLNEDPSSRSYRCPILEGAIKDKTARQIHRAMRGVAFAVALQRFRGQPIAALQDFNPDIRIACLVSICSFQRRPHLKAARITANAHGCAKASLIKSYSKEPHLLAAVCGIADRKAE